MIDSTDDTALPAPVRRLPVHRLGIASDDHVAVESPVALVFNGISHAVMMATPANLEAFAMGFAISEGLLTSPAECFGIELQVSAEGIEAHLHVAAAAEVRLKAARRQLVGRTGCGLCGIDSLRALDLSPDRVMPTRRASPTAILNAMAQLPSRQALNALTGAHHAAGWATLDGELLGVMEDVGRHNALDKLLGRRLLDKQRFDDGFIVMSSRASYELVLKCARLGVPTLATISAPTTLAVEIARQAGMGLFGFCRGQMSVNYADHGGGADASCGLG